MGKKTNGFQRVEQSQIQTEKILIEMKEAVKNLNHSSEVIASNNTKLVEMISALKEGTDTKFQNLNDTLKTYSKFILIAFSILAGLYGLVNLVPKLMGV